jgi:hypothetical protein
MTKFFTILPIWTAGGTIPLQVSGITAPMITKELISRQNIPSSMEARLLIQHMKAVNRKVVLSGGLWQV